MIKYTKDQLTKGIELTCVLYYGIGQYTKGQIRIEDDEFTYTQDPDFMHELIGKLTFPFKTNTDFDETSILIKAFENQKACVIAEKIKEVREIQDKIDSLLAITHQPAKPSTQPDDDEIPF